MVKIWPIIINWLIFKRRHVKRHKYHSMTLWKGNTCTNVPLLLKKKLCLGITTATLKIWPYNILHSFWTLLSYIKKHDSLLFQSRANSLDQKSADAVHNTTLLPSSEWQTLVHKTFYIIFYMILTFGFWNVSLVMTFVLPFLLFLATLQLIKW